jgi:hypothetical protein
MVPNRFKKVVFPPPEGPLMITNYPNLIPPNKSFPYKVTQFNAITKFYPFK